MKIKTKLNGVEYTFLPWDIRKEKELLLSTSEDYSVKDKVHLAYELLLDNQNRDNLNYQEMLYLLLETKSKICSDSQSLTYTCDRCHQVTEATIFISDSIHLEHQDDIIFESNNYKFTLSYGETLVECISSIISKETSSIVEPLKHLTIIDSLSIKEYDWLIYQYKSIKKGFSFKGKGSCLICANPVVYSPSDEDLINTITSITIKDYYIILTTLKQFGYLIQEINDFMPFELDIVLESTKKRG